MEQISYQAESYPHHLPREERYGADPDLLTDQIVGSPLSDRLILVHMKAGNIVIEPFEERNLQSSSYDLRLGQFYYEEQIPDQKIDLFNPYKRSHVAKVWGRPKKAAPAEYFMERFPDPQDWENIDKKDEIILFEPMRTYLCHTLEFVGMRNIGTEMMKARSTTGRIFLEVCKCAGWGDNGYINRWTMEITNNSIHHAIPIVVGTRIAQMAFFYTGETDRPYSALGNYQDTDDLEILESRWDPTNMLPRLKRDPKI